MVFEFFLRRESLLRGTLGAVLFGLALFGMSAVADEKRTPADLYVPTSAHFEADNGMRIQVAGLDDVQTLDDVLAFRERIAALEFAREDLLSWKILGDMGLTKVERKAVPPPPAPPGVIQGPVRHLPEWRKATVDVDAACYAMRSVCEGLHMFHVDTPQAHTTVFFGKNGVATRVDHFPASRAKNIARFDIDSGLLRSEKRFEGEWETVRQDASGTLFKRTNSRDDGGRTVTGERYLLVDPARDEIRLWAFFINGRLYRFEIALRSLPAATSPDCVVPELVLEFDCSGKDWRLDMHRFEKVALDQKPADGAYSYLLQKGDVYQGESFARKIRVGGLDVPTLTPDAAAALIQAGKNGA